MTEVKRMSLVKPTLQTRFHIDFDWWQKNDRDWRIYLWHSLCPEHQQVFASRDVTEQVDWVDPQTAEVQQVDALQHILISHCARQESFVTGQTALVDAIFRLFLANGNTPMTTQELGDRLGRQPLVILKTISGPRVYKGIRPCLE